MFIALSLAASLAVVQPETTAAPTQTAAPQSADTGFEHNLPPAYLEMRAAALEVARVPRDDSEDQVRRMAATDRDDSRYFNRAGATRDQYDFEWRQCRQIARRLASSRSNGAWMQSGFIHAGVVGGLLIGGLDAGFSERRARRDIRRHCLLARGWRMVEPDEAGRARIAALPRAEREAFFDSMIGAAEIEPGATVTDWASIEDGVAPKPDTDPVDE